MPQFGQKSLDRLSTCHEDLQKIFMEVIKHYDCTVTCGHREQAEQDEAFRTGHSKLRFPQSKHNSYPSMAVDVVPFPIDWKDKSRFMHFAGFVMATALSMGIKLRWGGDWDSDFQFKEEKFQDLPHFELGE
jgi:peptidoglycan L-alanyl-D-glutamate endopeptidase CwlK